jgi:hypothetical protein
MVNQCCTYTLHAHADCNLLFNVRGAFYRRTGGPMRTELCFLVRTMRRTAARAAVLPAESALRAAFISARCLQKTRKTFPQGGTEQSVTKLGLNGQDPPRHPRRVESFTHDRPHLHIRGSRRGNCRRDHSTCAHEATNPRYLEPRHELH